MTYDVVTLLMLLFYVFSVEDCILETNLKSQLTASHFKNMLKCFS